MSSRQLKSHNSNGEQWASGRKLTTAQRERKRAIDRLRAKKRRTQVADRVAGLESRLEELSAELERAYVISSQRDERPEPISETLPTQDRSCALGNPASVGTWSNTSTSFSILPAPGWMSATQPGRYNATEPKVPSLHSVHSDISTTTPANEALLGMIDEDLLLNQLDENGDGATVTKQLTVSKASSQMPQRKIAPGGDDCQNIFNNAVTAARGLSGTTVCGDPSLNQDALIRGVLFGWDLPTATSSNQWCCPLWQILQLLDKRIFHLSGTITRLCTLRMIHSLLLCLVKAASYESLPPWYRPRPSQYYLPHALAIDVLPWPGLRERAVLCQNLTQTNKFWTEVIYSFRFCWPYTVHDIVSLDSNTGLYEFSGMFNHHLYEIQMWRMDSKFFESFPETYDDIMPAQVIERPIHLASSEKSSGSWNTTRWALLLPLPEDTHEKDVDSDQLDELFSLSDICNWDAGSDFAVG
ncbi:hypothetical protein LTS17_001001 [Exophiala oligosperma]